MITAPDGWLLWTSDMRPGREHDATCARTHPELLPALDVWIDSNHAALGDLGYEGENQRPTCPIKATAGEKLTDTQRTVNTLHSATRALAERANSLLKMITAQCAAGTVPDAYQALASSENGPSGSISRHPSRTRARCSTVIDARCCPAGPTA